MYIHRALPFDCSMYFASNDTLFNLLRIYFEHTVHSPQCTFGCKLHSVRCSLHWGSWSSERFFNQTSADKLGACCTPAHGSSSCPEHRWHRYFFVGSKLIGLRDLALWFTAPTSSKFKDHDIKTDVTVVACLKNLNVNYVTPGIGLHRALVSIRLCQYGCYICVVIFFGWTCCWMYWKAWALVPCISRECETQLTSLQCETRASSEQVSVLSRFPWRFPKEHLLVDLVVCRVTFLQRSWTLVQNSM